MTVNLIGCSFTTLDNHMDGVLTAMNFLAEISKTINARIESNSRSDDSVEIVYDNGVVFTNKYYEDISQTCSFEGPKEIIDEQLMDYAKVCFNNFTSQQIQNLVNILRETGCYEETINNCVYYVEYQDGCLVFKLTYE